jgi:hypothetical protein
VTSSCSSCESTSPPTSSRSLSPSFFSPFFRPHLHYIHRSAADFSVRRTAFRKVPSSPAFSAVCFTAIWRGRSSLSPTMRNPFVPFPHHLRLWDPDPLRFCRSSSATSTISCSSRRRRISLPGFCESWTRVSFFFPFPPCHLFSHFLLYRYSRVRLLYLGGEASHQLRRRATRRRGRSAAPERPR